MSTFSSSANASSSAPASSDASCTFETPTLDPARAGLTKTGSPRAAASARTPSGSRSQRARVTVTHGETGTPAACSTIFMKCLSMHSAESSTPPPAYGMPSVSKKPWTVPSSPCTPCRIGSTTSTAPSSSTVPSARRTRSVRSAPPSGHSTRVPLSTTSGRLRGVEGELVGIVVLEDEHAVAGDADRDHPVAVTIDRPKHPARRCGTDRVLAGSTAKEHRHRRPVHSASSRPSGCRHLLSGGARCRAGSWFRRAPS